MTAAGFVCDGSCAGDELGDCSHPQRWENDRKRTSGSPPVANARGITTTTPSRRPGEDGRRANAGPPMGSATARDKPGETGCKLCGAPKLAWQVFCGSACSLRWESGERPPRRDDLDFLVRLADRLDSSWFRTRMRARTRDRDRIDVKKRRTMRGIRLAVHWLKRGT